MRVLQFARKQPIESWSKRSEADVRGGDGSLYRSMTAQRHAKMILRCTSVVPEELRTVFLLIPDCPTLSVATGGELSGEVNLGPLYTNLARPHTRAFDSFAG